MSHLKICFLLLLVCCGSQQVDNAVIKLDNKFGELYDEALDAIFSIAIRLEALLSETNLKSGRNFLVSPLSMAVAVGELMLGAKGVFEEQLHELLVFERNSSENSVRHIKDSCIQHVSLHEQLGDLMKNLQHQGDKDDSYHLKTASILFHQKDLIIKDQYKNDVLRFYGTATKELDFRKEPHHSLNVVNKWVRENTNDLIKELSPGPIPKYTSAILANTVYFKADWEVPFASEINRKGVFKTSPNETVNVTFMIGEFENYRYFEHKELGCRMVVIPYEKNEINLYIILPNENNGEEYDINKFVQTLRYKDVEYMIDNTKNRKVTMVLPKLSLSNTISVIEPLKKYNAYKNSQPNPTNSIIRDNIENLENKVKNFKNLTVNTNVNFDLSKISDDPRFKINNIYQQMTLSVNEKGTEAAAISAGIVDYIMDSVVYRVDRPFLFFIRHENTKATLFWGTIVDPTEVN